MAKRKELVAMLLAGGQGSRLYPLTKNLAKPALYFGGKYRIIDFPLSNCINSNIDTVGVLTQYQPLELNDYIGSGGPWDLDRTYGGAHILPPYQQTEGTDWYKGTANAIYQNIPFMEKYNPEYVLILSGDHIYRMNYGRMLQAHKDKKADCTIAVMNVPIEEASRFGILTADEDDRITKFEEKPANPTSTKASMGIYIFSYEIMKKYLQEDEANPASSNDFGKDIIPTMLERGCRMYAHEFKGYWKDVGTISSFWQSNMDMLDASSGFDLGNPAWKIYYRHGSSHPHYAGESAVIKESLVSEGCEVNGNVENSVIFPNVVVEKDAIVRDSVILPGTIVRAGAMVNYTVTSTNVDIGETSVVGESKEIARGKITVLGENVVIPQGRRIEAGLSLETADLAGGEVSR
ncbi:MAG: glucose-1-phosphate adenylyltransferase [Eubacterium sp.]|nr:glucose-1-phosphate adenylyltransferase [Eubacterium sp.]